MTVVEYLLRDISNTYDDYSISLQDEEGNILFYGNKYDLITSDKFEDFILLKVEEETNEKILRFCVI